MNLKQFISKFKKNNVFYPRAKTPTVIQMDALECGSASLSIVMGYYGKFISPENAREECGVSRDGSKAINIIKAARKYGFEAEGYSLDVDDLKEMKPPFIIYWKFEHFLVVEGFAKDKVYINDPATGPRTINYDELDKSYTGVVLEIVPAETFKKEGRPEASVLTMILGYLKKSTEPFSFLLSVTFLLIIPNVAVAILAKIYVDQILVNSQRQWMVPLVIGLLISAAFIFTLIKIQYHFFLKFKFRLVLANTSQFFWRILRLPMSFFQQRSMGDVASRMEVYNKVADILAYEVPQSSIGSVGVFIYLIIMFFISWELALLILIFSSINFIFLLFAKRKITDLGRRFANDRGNLFGIEINAVKIIEEVKACSAESVIFNRWSGYQAKVITSQQGIALYNSLLSIIPKFIFLLNIAVTLAVGSLLIIKGYMTPGGLVSFQILYLNFEKPLRDLTELIGKLSQIKGDLVRLNDVINFPMEEKMSFEAEKRVQQDEDTILQMVDIGFGYSRLEPPIFENFNVRLKKGEAVAIVGSSGCGKSSLAKLTCSLVQPWFGSIYLNGKLLNLHSKTEIADTIGYVDQNIYLFEGTVRDNISLWDATVTDDKINDVLELVGLEKYLESRGGLYFIVKERGKNLSGGQAQRMAIARAILRKPQLLILDEATSALDSIGEMEIYANLKKIGCSLFIVAHRLSAIRDSNEIIVLDDGKVKQRGKHSYLINEPGLYQQLVRSE